MKRTIIFNIYPTEKNSIQAKATFKDGKLLELLVLGEEKKDNPYKMYNDAYAEIDNIKYALN